MTGYSGTPLARKLGFKEGQRVYIDDAPPGYRSWLADLPAGVVFLPRPEDGMDLVHLFSTQAKLIDQKLAVYISQIAADGTIWVSWPKKASKVATDVTEDVIRALALPRGLVDVKVCAVSDIWSGLKLVIRKENRKGRTAKKGSPKR
jgi:hypothetical protein